MAALSAPVASKKLDGRRVSCDTLCSSNSSCILQKRKQVHPLASGIKIKNGGSSIKQRVLSAKFLRFKTLQNELNDANYHIAQLVNENKILKNLQKRQDHALARYEGTSAELPKVLESHQEEIRSLQTRNKNLRKNIKELNEQMKSKDDELNSIKDQNKHLMGLCKNKNLEERDKLSKKLEEAELALKERDATISVLNRRIAVETKNCKFKVNAEVTRNKQLQKELHRALAQIEQLEGKERPADTRVRRNVSNERKKALMLKLNTYQEKEEKHPLLQSKKLDSNHSSSSLLVYSEDTDSYDSNCNVHAHENGEDSGVGEDRKSKTSLQSDGSSSEIQLKQVVNSWHKKKINEYCSEAVEIAQSCNQSVELHTLDFEQTSKETDELLTALRESDDISSKLNSLAGTADKITFFDYTDLFKPRDKKASDGGAAPPDNEDKEKLLAKLKAVDNGDAIEFTNIKKTKNDLMKELFG